MITKGSGAICPICQKWNRTFNIQSLTFGECGHKIPTEHSGFVFATASAPCGSFKNPSQAIGERVSMNASNDN